MSQFARTSRAVRDALKNIDEVGTKKIVSRLLEKSQEGALKDLFHNAILVPAPRSAPLLTNEAAWPARSLCEEMVKMGLGKSVVTALERKIAVPKSAYQKSGEMPTAKIHYDSMSCSTKINSFDKIVIVDDQITLGATAIAMASRIKDRAPGANVTCFAVLRTRNFLPDIEQIIDITEGTVSYDATRDKASRNDGDDELMTR